jgi:Domain of unknown function (DUF1906)
VSRARAWRPTQLLISAAARWIYLSIFATAALVASQVVGNAPTALAAGAPQTYVYHQGFDTCQGMTAGILSAWWTNTPNWTVGLYLGGEDGAAVGCGAPSTSVWNDAVSTGYGVEAFWYGAQMPTSCGGAGGRPAYISLNANTATTEGENEASSAAAQAAKYGLPLGAPIYFDLEGFANNSGCLTAAESFVNGWSYEINDHTSYTGDLYGSSCSSYLTDMSAHSNVPGAIAPDDPGFDVTGVYGLQCLPNNKWDHDQRAHQTKNEIRATFNGVQMYVDEDCVDGPVIAKADPAAATACGSPY